MTLPQNNKLPIPTLAGIFSNTTATYKFYWFVALLDIVVKERKTRISFWEIIAGMVVESWYQIHYFKLSFGKSDSLFDKSLKIQNAFQISIESDKNKVKKQLLDNLGETKKFLKAFFDGYPVSKGHTLIIPKRHVASYFDLTTREQRALWLLVNHCKKLLTERFHPDGFNVGINVGEAAGQSVFHVHIHLIPRYKGDVENPKGGVRGVIHEKQKY